MRILIAGGGAAAVEAAETVRLQQPESEIVIFSNEKVLPYRRPLLPRLINAGTLPEYFFIHNQDFYTENNIELRLDAEVAAVDPVGKTIRLANGKNEHFDSLLLATGSHARKLPGNDTALTLHDYADLEKIRTAFAANPKVLITGGGVLGLEIAGELLKAGGRITVCERSKYLFENMLNEPAAEFLKNLLTRNKGLKIISDSENKPPRNRDFLNISAIGTTPNIIPFDAPHKYQTLQCLQNMQITDLPANCNIFAAGDCVECCGKNNLYYSTARKQGKVAGINLAGGKAVYKNDLFEFQARFIDTVVYCCGRITGNDLQCAFDSDKKSLIQLFYTRNELLAGCVLINNSAKSSELREIIRKNQEFLH